jgi:hypothetical protein
MTSPLRCGMQMSKMYNYLGVTRTLGPGNERIADGPYNGFLNSHGKWGRLPAQTCKILGHGHVHM